MTITDGEYIPDSADEIEDAMMETAKAYFGDDLNDDQYAVIRLFYRPIAEELASIQEDVGLVLASSQIDNATGEALDLLTSLIGVQRKPAKKATGEVTFSRDSAASTDYTIPKGTVVQTDSLEPIRFETTEEAILLSGTTSVSGVPVKAQEGGTDGNLGANTLVVMPDSPTGIQDVTNPNQTGGGEDRETDEALRTRAKEGLAEGSAATAAALISAARGIEGVRGVTIYINDTNTDNNYGNGLPAHSFELLVSTEDATTQATVGQTILDTKAAGDYSVAGVNGTSVSITGDLPNGQTHTIEYSEPIEVQIYVDVDLVKTEEYAGDSEIQDNVVKYIGGILNNEVGVYGLEVSEDVIYTKVQSAIMNTEGVHDITSLNIGTSSSPTGTSNVAIATNEQAISDATDGSITVATSDK